MGPVKRISILLLSALLVTAMAGTSASGKMRSTKLAPNVCETTGGGRFVEIKQFPGEMIDRRLKRDVRFLIKKYNIFITDGYSHDPAHSQNGEHPLGLALDIVPNFANGGRWRDITRLAKWAEPSQDQPRSPFRWVGYDGDANHGRGHHLHLSWAHSTQKPYKPARTVYSVKCPKPKKTDPPADETPGEGDTTTPASGGVGSSRRSSASGGISAQRFSAQPLAAPVPESDGIGFGN